MDDILAALKAAVDALEEPDRIDPELRADMMFQVRAFNLIEAYQALEQRVKVLRNVHQVHEQPGASIN